MDEKRKDLLKSLPKIDEVIGLLEKKGIHEKASREIILETCRGIVQKLRDDILIAPDKKLTAVAADATLVARSVEASIDDLHHYKLHRVVVHDDDRHGGRGRRDGGRLVGFLHAKRCANSRERAQTRVRS